MILFSGLTAIIPQPHCKTLASIIAHIDYDTLSKSANGQPGMTRAEYEEFLEEVGGGFIDAGLLDEDLNLTGFIRVPL